MSVNSDSWIVGAAATLISGVVAAVVALFKLRPDTNRVVVSAAEGAVVVQTSVITNLQKEIERLGSDHQDCEKRVTDQKKDYQLEIAELRLLIKAIDDRKGARRDGDPLPILPEEKGE